MAKAQPTRRRRDTGQAGKDTSIDTYRARRDFAATPEPAPATRRARKDAPIFVVQKHAARRLHWDFRLEHGGVLWSWAVPKGPSLDPADKRLAVRTEDHPLDYADFAGTIPTGHYGAGTVETWDRGTWTPVAEPAAALAAGELKFALHGDRLHGGFVLVRLRPKPRDRTENWLLIKEHDAAEKPDADAAALEQPAPGRKNRAAPAAGARRAALPRDPGFQLAALAKAPPRAGHWLLEIKFDGYRLGARKDGDSVRLVSRGGQDWTARLPRLAAAIGRLPASHLLLDGELVAEDDQGISRFPLIQQAFSDGDDRGLRLYAFDLLHLDGWDLRDCRLADRKAALARALAGGHGTTIRLSEHQDGEATPLFTEACAMRLEGIVCKDADAPYRAGRGQAWLKLKCQGREEFVVLGWTPPSGSRTGIGALHMGYHDETGALHYAGGVGTGFDERMLTLLRKRLDASKAAAPRDLRHAGEPPPSSVRWVKPALVAEIRYGGWSGAGRLRHASFLGLREDKPASAVVRPIADPQAARGQDAESEARIVRPRAAAARTAGAGAGARIVVAKAPPRGGTPRQVGGVRLTHPDRALWPGLTKQALADYWLAVASHALPGIARRPLALLRCPDGIDGEHFFQKHRSPGMPDQIRDGAGAFVAIDDADGLLACAQMAAIELHAWGATEDDPAHPDQLVFDLDPGEGVAFAAVVQAAHDVRERLAARGLSGFCRTTGGHGLHVVVPLKASADWNAARAFCRAFAETMTRAAPDRYLATLSKARRRGLILVDWLRNGEGATAVASFSPRARPGATVAMPVSWRAVTTTLDPAAFTIQTVPGLLKRRRADPWADFAASARTLPAPDDNEGKRR